VHASVLLPPDTASATVARRFAERQLGDWGLPGLVDRARLLVSELVINAVIHARTESRLMLWSDGRCLRVEVSDRSPTLPRVDEYVPQAPSGRGLRIVAELADQWGVEEGRGGKTVWFELLPAAPAAGS
jgi:anti-sigma regulatory factor (Ser/Thr protein kinase)